ncbi:MAG: riboflavin kinase [Rickettsiales endosymbiont of Dermacentor nuttalli]
MLPRFGVYAVKTSIHNAIYKSIVNIGIRSSILSNTQTVIESHIFDTLEKDLYVIEVCIENYYILLGKNKNSLI